MQVYKLNDTQLSELAAIDAEMLPIQNELDGLDKQVQQATKIVDAITPIAISIAVIMIIYAGFLFMTAGGNEDKISTARKALIWSLVGLAVILIGSGFVKIIEDILGT